MTNTVIECSSNTNEGTLSRIKRESLKVNKALQRTSSYLKVKYQKYLPDEVRIDSKDDNHEPHIRKSLCDNNESETINTTKSEPENTNEGKEESNCIRNTSQIKKKHSRVSQISNDSYDFTYKVTVLGDTRVGKTSILARLNGLSFTSNRAPTVGVDYVSKIFRNDGVASKLQIWDTPGQERFQTMTKYHTDGANGLILVYDITNKDSLEWVEYWLDNMAKKTNKDETEPVTILIIGNKDDLDGERTITEEEGQKVADRYFCHSFHEVSAATDSHHISRIFQNLSDALTEIHHPKMLDSHMSPFERKEKYDKLAENKVCNGLCACGGLSRDNVKIKIKPNKVKRRSKVWSLVSCTSAVQD